MTNLKRYKVEGGIEKLVKLIETSPQKAQISILNTIEKEDEDFARRVKRKIFLFDDLFYQKEHIITELIKSIPTGVWAYALLPFEKEQRDKILFCADRNKKRDIIEEFEVIENSATRSQSVSAQKRIIGEARELEEKGNFKLEKDESSTPVNLFSSENTGSTSSLDIDSSGGKTLPITEETADTEKSIPQTFLSISVSDITEEELKCDFYMMSSNKFKPYRKKGSIVTKRDIDRLLKMRIYFLFISIKDIKVYFDLSFLK